MKDYKIVLLLLFGFIIVLCAVDSVSADAIDGNKNYTNFYTDDDFNMYYTDVYTSDKPTPTEKIYIAPHTTVKEQTNGDCFAFGTASTIESSIIKKTGYYTDLSEEHIANIHYVDQESIDDGGYLPLVVENIEKHGVLMGYTVKQSQGGFEVEHNKLFNDFLTDKISRETYDIGLKTLKEKYSYGFLKTIHVDAHYVDLKDTALVKKAIKQYGAVVCALNIGDYTEIWAKDIYKALKGTKIVKNNGEYQMNNDKSSGGDYMLTYVHKGGDADHCVSLIGWNDYIGCFIFKNSYGIEKGGEGGYGFVKYKDASLLTDQSAFVFDVETKNIKPFNDVKKVKTVKKIKISKKVKSLKKAKKIKVVKKELKQVKKVNAGKLTIKFKKGLVKIVYYLNKSFTNYRIV